MNYFVLAQQLPDTGVATWLAPLLLVITLTCVTAWYIAINRRLLGREVVTYEERKPVPWGADGAALAFMAVAAAVMTFFSATIDPQAKEPQGPANDFSVVAPIATPSESTRAESNASQSSAGVSQDSEAFGTTQGTLNRKRTKAEPKIDLSAATQYASISALLVVLMIGWQRMQVCASWKDFGFPTSLVQFANDISLGQLTFAAALLPVYAVQFLLVSLLGAPSSHQVLEELINDPSGQMLLVAGLMAVVVAPLFEEFSFRVMLQGWLEKIANRRHQSVEPEEGTTNVQRKPFWPILVSSFAFAIAHTGQGYAPVALFVLACFLGYLYRQTHRLAPCVVAHMAFNALSLALAFGTAPGVGQQ